MSSMAIPVCSHLAWRFREWYRHPKLLSMVACPPLKDILQDMVRATSNTNLGTDDRRPFVLYSCHDVTLLAFLYAIGADFLETTVEEWQRKGKHTKVWLMVPSGTG